jgi:hypothetical protein
MAKAESRDNSPNVPSPERHSGSVRPDALSPSSNSGAGGQIPPSQYGNLTVPVRQGGQDR